MANIIESLVKITAVVHHKLRRRHKRLLSHLCRALGDSQCCLSVHMTRREWAWIRKGVTQERGGGCGVGGALGEEGRCGGYVCRVLVISECEADGEKGEVEVEPAERDGDCVEEWSEGRRSVLMQGTAQL